MKRNEYLNKRKELLNQATKALEENNLELFNEKEKEINKLDEQFESFAKAEANMNALREAPLMNRGSEMLAQEGEILIDPSNKKDDKNQYKNAWA